MEQLKMAKSPPPPTSQSVWRHNHILDIDDFSLQEIGLVMETTDVMMGILSRRIKKVPALRGKTVVTLFYEPSTRTRSSFELAAKNLSADVINLNVFSSSTVKGECLIDTMATIEAIGADIVIMRHKQSGAPYLAARHAKANIINGGDGWHAHPTQALLDLYTIRQHKNNINGLKITIVGDIRHSRVAHSNIWGLTAMGAEVTLCAPPTLLPYGLNSSSSSFPAVKIEPQIEKALINADVVMGLRLQKERQQAGLLPSIREYIRFYQITEKRFALAKIDAILMHPGPVNEDIELASPLMRHPRSVISSQVTNGVAVRMALLYLLSGRNEL
jgi:aspartate carbamoyltransferase catalytic subunit